jgi:hypothetical protein
VTRSGVDSNDGLNVGMSVQIYDFVGAVVGFLVGAVVGFLVGSSVG